MEFTTNPPPAMPLSDNLHPSCPDQATTNKAIMATIDVMYNACYGGFSISKSAMTEYKARGGEAESSRQIKRHDPVMVAIVKEMGVKADGEFAKIRLETIPKRFEGFYKISEYDGSESVVIKYNVYKVDTVKAILKDADLTEGERLARASAVLDEEFEVEEDGDN